LHSRSASITATTYCWRRGGFTYASSGKSRHSLDVAERWLLLEFKTQEGWNCHAPVTGCGLSSCLNSGTSLERIAPESLTPLLSEFVHGHIWWHCPSLPQNPVKGRQTAATYDRHRSPVVGLARKIRTHGASATARTSAHHCVFNVALAGCGIDMNCVACRTPNPIGVGTEAR
jgi:hypothetical protein